MHFIGIFLSKVVSMTRVCYQSLSLEFPFNCDTSSGLWHTAHPVILQHYPGMRGQVLPVQSMSARCMVLSLSITLYHAISLLISRRSPSLHLYRSFMSKTQCELLPLACSMIRSSHSLADRDANHSIIAWPRRRKKPEQLAFPSMEFHPEIQGRSLRNQFST